MQDKVNEIVSDFELFEDWEEKYAYIIDLGKQLPPMADILKTDDNKVRGCTSQVWMIFKQNPQNRIEFIADSDAVIVRGLIGLLVKIYNGHTPAEARAIDIEELFEKIGLSTHLSPNRRNGFFAMVSRITHYGAGL